MTADDQERKSLDCIKSLQEEGGRRGREEEGGRRGRGGGRGGTTRYIVQSEHV